MRKYFKIPVNSLKVKHERESCMNLLSGIGDQDKICSRNRAKIYLWRGHGNSVEISLDECVGERNENRGDGFEPCKYNFWEWSWQNSTLTVW